MVLNESKSCVLLLGWPWEGNDGGAGVENTNSASAIKPAFWITLLVG